MCACVGLSACAQKRSQCIRVYSLCALFRIVFISVHAKMLILARLAFACIALRLYIVLDVKGQSTTGPLCPECDVATCENETLVQEICPDSTLVADPCGCCKVCGRIFGEPCGGAYEYLGKCEYHLVCTAKRSEYLKGVNISGVCTSKQCG